LLVLHALKSAKFLSCNTSWPPVGLHNQITSSSWMTVTDLELPYLYCHFPYRLHYWIPTVTVDKHHEEKSARNTKTTIIQKSPDLRLRLTFFYCDCHKHLLEFPDTALGTRNSQEGREKADIIIIIIVAL
jgi:hypothetical protein